LIKDYRSDSEAAHKRWTQALARLQRPERQPQVAKAVTETLSPDQLSAWQAYQASEIENAQEAAAQRDLSTLQMMLSLTKEQKDQAFQVLSALGRKEALLPVEELMDEAAIANRYNERLEALRPILSEEQMDAFSHQGLGLLNQQIMGPLMPSIDLLGALQASPSAK
jgi:hypothetical protein